MNDDLLQELLEIARATNAPLGKPSERCNERFEAMLAKYGPIVLTEDKVRLVILQLLRREGRADGGEIIQRLNRLKVRHELQGDGIILALLARMEEDGLVSAEFDDAMLRKRYWISERGSELLEQGSESVRNISEAMATLWAT